MTRRILVAEDDDAARKLLAKYLEGKGYTVTAVADGQECMDALAKDPFDLVILDVMMPRLTGFQVLEQVRAKGDATPILMATAAASPDDIVRGLGLGADDYVTKPFSFPVLLARIELRLRLRTVPTIPPPPTFEATDVVDEEELQSGILARIKSVAQKLKDRARPLPVTLQPGAVLADRYVVGEKLGEGGFGAVFRARHIDLGHDVALKVLHPGGAIESFRREAQNACRVRHENAVRVFDFGVLPGSSAFFVMELLDGPTLEHVLQTAKLPPARALSILRALLGALASAHRAGVVHRDVKPQNVVLHREDDRDIPKLCDFGIARLVDEGGEKSSVVVGSSAYISPERILGKRYDGRTDVYACGIVFYRMVAGRLPFDVDERDFEKVALWHVNELAAPTGVSPAIDRVVMSLLARDPETRPTAEEAASLVDSLTREPPPRT